MRIEEKTLIRNVLAAGVVALCSSTMVNAATLNASGASRVDVNGTFYDVRFLDGSCRELYDGCNEASDFTFTTSSESFAASQALFDLFNLPAYAGFSSNPASTNGCSFSDFCYILTPYGRTGRFGFDVASTAFRNLSGTATDSVFAWTSYGPDTSSSSFTTTVYAAWSEAAPIPLPASLSTLLAGVAGLGLIARRRKRRVA